VDDGHRLLREPPRFRHLPQSLHLAGGTGVEETATTDVGGRRG